MNPRMLALLAVGHMTTDVYQGSLPAEAPAPGRRLKKAKTAPH